MMGPRQVEQGALFYEFSLDAHVPGDHLLRSIDRFVDLSEVRRELAPFYSSMGRPSVDPELMIRMLIVGYCFGIRSERRLCEEVHLNLAYRWFCRLGLDGDVPDHSTFSKTGTAASATAIYCGRCARPSAEVRLLVGPGGAIDRRPEGACVLRLRHQLSDRSRPRDHCRCRGKTRDQAG
jgi:transposase